MKLTQKQQNAISSALKVAIDTKQKLATQEKTNEHGHTVVHSANNQFFVELTKTGEPKKRNGVLSWCQTN